MRKYLIFLSIFLLALPVLGQERAGNIYGKVVDEEGEPLPGVTVTLTGSKTAPVTQISGVRGDFRFISLPPARDYNLKAGLEGFKTKTQEGIFVTVGTNVSLTIVMEMGVLEEIVTVVAENPLVDLKRTGVSANIDREMIESVTTGRDTLSLMAMVPSVSPTRAYLGEVSQGYMINSRARGSMQSSYWGQQSIDGMRIIGKYYDQDAWEEVHVSIGGTNFKSRSGDLTINMVSKRGGNDFSFGGRFLVMDEKLQADNLTDELRAEGVPGTNRVIDNRDYGFNFGGPIIKDKLWFFMSYGVKDAIEYSITATELHNKQTIYNGKLNLQLMPQNKLEIWGMVMGMKWSGVEVSPENPLGREQHERYHFGSPYVHIVDEHAFGDNLLVQFNGFYQEGGYFRTAPNNPNNELLGIYDQGSRLWIRYADQLACNSPIYNFDFSLNYFNDDLFGVSHEIKAAFEWDRWSIIGVRDINRRNLVERINYTTKTIDIDGDGYADVVPDIARLETRRWGEIEMYRYCAGGYLSDTVTAGHFSATLGLRYDRGWFSLEETEVQNSLIRYKATLNEWLTPQTADIMSNILPGFSMPAIDPEHTWDFISPRLGIVWNIGGKGTTTAKLSLGQYPYRGDIVNMHDGRKFLFGGEVGWADYWWMDDNGDGMIDYRELYWHYAANFAPYRIFDDAGNFIGDWDDARGSFWGAYDYQNPTKLIPPLTTVDKSVNCERAQEIALSLEHEFFPDFMCGINLTYKIYDHFNWTVKYWPDTGKIESKDDYVQVGTVPSTVGGISTGDGAGQPYYLYSEDYIPTIYRYETRRPDYNWKYYGVDLVFQKRMSNNWMLSGSFTLQRSALDFGDNGYLNPTEIWAYEGRTPDSMFPRWLFKLHGLYSLPYGFNVGISLFSRGGWNLSERITIVDYNAPNPKSRSVSAYIGKYEDLKLDPWISLSVRLEKIIRIADKGTIYLMADIFNVPNLSTVSRRYNRDIGTYYPHDGSFVPNPRSEQAREIIHPRLLRLGVRFQF